MAIGQLHSQNIRFERMINGCQIGNLWELGSNYLLISRDFKNCMVIRAIYVKVFALANR